MTTPAPRSISIKMTWENSLPLLLVVLSDGNADGRKMAAAELGRMACLADLYVASEDAKTIEGEMK